MQEGINAGCDPATTINVLRGARFCIEAWKYQITPRTCANCFVKFSVLGPVLGPSRCPRKTSPFSAHCSTCDNLVAEADIYSMVSELQGAGRICNSMQMANFLEPEGEVVRHSSAGVIASILEQYKQSRKEDTDKEEVLP